MSDAQNAPEEEAGPPFPPFGHVDAVPIDPTVGVYDVVFGPLYPTEYTGWKDEVLSWKKTAYLHGGLNPTDTYRIWGPDAVKLLREHCVNSFERFPVGASKHAIMCDKEGRVVVHGMLVRRAEDEFIAYWLGPWIDFLVERGGYDVQGENLTGQVYLFQLAGPRSLEILEAATGRDLHDVRFLQERRSSIGGSEVEVSIPTDVLRIGMAGTLAYELHGPIKDAHAVYNALLEAGEPFGLRRLGRAQYNMNHTENGFPQEHIHFIHPWLENPELVQYFIDNYGMSLPPVGLYGSAGDDASLRYRTPYDLGWGHLVSYDHDFLGREALEKVSAAPPRTMRTLVWNGDDVLDIYRSHFEEGEEYQFMRFEGEPVNRELPAPSFSDAVLKDGEIVGYSSGRIYSYYYRKMISLVSIDVALADIGTEVVVLWGLPGTRQKEIRATIERFPLYNENRNETFDTSTIPRAAGLVP
ncbi:MAG TPA: hypothetical protein VNT53_07245 [Pseudolysinimonas sp.]|nr:hypothetical protein [Pseudolysinimonas sp.]